jgi:HSP20 family protein
MTHIGIGPIATAHSKILGKTPGKALVDEKLKLHARPHPSHQGKDGHEAEEAQLSVDILHTENEMLILCPIAGVEKTDIRVSLQEDVLTIRGERKAIAGLDLHKALVRELFWGTFSRSIVLPDHIDRKAIEARVHEHVLIIKIPKTEDFKSRIIHIEA